MKKEDWILGLTAGLVIYLLNEKRKDTNKIIDLNNSNNQLANKSNRLVGIAEQHALTFAAGLASNKIKPEKT